MPYTYSAAEGAQSDLAPVKDGDYEATVEKMGERVSKNGSRSISIQFRIRSDVEQEEKGRVVFDDIWAEKDHPEYYNRRRINQLLGALKCPEGQEFQSASDVARWCTGGQVIVAVRNEEDEWQGEKKTRTRVKFYMPTKHGPKALGSPESQGIEPLSEDDLPF